MGSKKKSTRNNGKKKGRRAATSDAPAATSDAPTATAGGAKRMNQLDAASEVKAPKFGTLREANDRIEKLAEACAKFQSMGLAKERTDFYRAQIIKWKESPAATFPWEILSCLKGVSSADIERIQQASKEKRLNPNQLPPSVREFVMGPCSRCNFAGFYSCSLALTNDCSGFLLLLSTSLISLQKAIARKIKSGDLELHKVTRDDGKKEGYLDARDLRGDVSLFLHQSRDSRLCFYSKCALSFGKNEFAGFLGEVPHPEVSFHIVKEELIAWQLTSPHREQFQHLGRVLTEVDQLIYDKVLTPMNKFAEVPGLEGYFFLSWKLLKQTLTEAASKVRAANIQFSREEIVVTSSEDDSEHSN